MECLRNREVVHLLPFLALLLTSCTENATNQPKSYPDANPTSQTLRNVKFLEAIAATDGADVLHYAAKIQANEKTKEETLFVTCQEFETTVECDRRKAEIRAPQRPNGPGYTAFVIDAGFKYDADTGTLEITENYSDSIKTYLKEIDGQLTIEPVGSKPRETIAVHVDRDRAKRWRVELQQLRLVIIISLEDLPRPVMSGDNISSEELSRVSAELLTPGSSGNSQSMIDALQMKRFNMKARVIRVFVFNPKDGGVDKPIYDWVTPDRKYVR